MGTPVWAQTQPTESERAAPEGAALPYALPEELKLVAIQEGLQLSTVLHFALPTLVEEALQQGIPVYFVQSASLLQSRWYWSDKTIARTERYMRLSFQPLTRRWRLQTSAIPLTDRTHTSANLGVALDSLADALAVMQRITHWHIAQSSELPDSGALQLEVQLRVDTSQLPRPLQTGLTGRTGWSVLAVRQRQIEAREWQ